VRGTRGGGGRLPPPRTAEALGFLGAITASDLCGQSRGPARVLISSLKKGTLLEFYQGAWIKLTAAFCFVFKDPPFGARHSAWSRGKTQHHATGTSPSCKRKIHFLLSTHISSEAALQELTSENDPHSHRRETAFYFTSLKPPRQQLFLPAHGVR